MGRGRGLLGYSPLEVKLRRLGRELGEMRDVASALSHRAAPPAPEAGTRCCGCRGESGGGAGVIPRVCPRDLAPGAKNSATQRASAPKRRSGRAGMGQAKEAVQPTSATPTTAEKIMRHLRTRAEAKIVADMQADIQNNHVSPAKISQHKTQRTRLTPDNSQRRRRMGWKPQHLGGGDRPARGECPIQGSVATIVSCFGTTSPPDPAASSSRRAYRPWSSTPRECPWRPPPFLEKCRRRLPWGQTEAEGQAGPGASIVESVWPSFCQQSPQRRGQVHHPRS